MSYFNNVVEQHLYKDPWTWTKVTYPIDMDKIIDTQVKIKCLKAGVWLAADGPIQICKMTDSHLQNAFNLVKKRMKDEVDIIAIEVLQKEIDARKEKEKE